ncbi:MAG TPA: Coenzyme F420 hydrogenase/dehydrogenase, beta subunit C-terminal domain [Bacillota bacterium]|nr:Coenzyme F420 hydrogenase/dehydrogenase, beta subunit C-terminal domain [Bacillota bacterium]
MYCLVSETSQIAGLRLYLRREYDNRLTLDIVYHGVPSQKVFQKYLKYLEKEHGGRIRSYSFRYKTCDSNGIWNSKNVSADIGCKHITMVTRESYICVVPLWVVL